MGELVGQWYQLLGSLNRALAEPIRALSDDIGLAPVTALLLGVLGALSPCQLTTGLSALALIGRRPDRRPLIAGIAYVAGKALIYALLGGAFVILGSALATSTIPVIQVVRRVLGPLMILIGLVLVGALRSRLTLGLGERVAASAADRLDATKPQGAFVLGMAFALAFCPTLFLLFFGLTIPLALASPGGLVFPALFALGTAAPLLVLLALLGLGLGGTARASNVMQRAQPILTRLAGFVLIAAGSNDTIVYWFV
ncbi:MAG: sulfite exporter TauE/SafE family protein [Candidatus Limnocylindria bacterium]